MLIESPILQRRYHHCEHTAESVDDGIVVRPYHQPEPPPFPLGGITTGRFAILRQSVFMHVVGAEQSNFIQPPYAPDTHAVPEKLLPDPLSTSVTPQPVGEKLIHPDTLE